MLFLQDEILVDESITNQSFDFSILKYVGWTLAFLLFFIVIYLLFKYIKIVLELEDSLKKLKNEVYDVKSENFKTLNKVDQKIKEFIKKNETTNPPKNTSQLTVQEEPTQPITFEIEKEASSEESEQVSKSFFKTPYEDNVFLIADGKTAPNEKTIYCISKDTLMIHDNINTEAMNSAINSMDLVIKTACLVLNSKEPNHTKIIMVEPGKVIKEGEDYRILEKVKVKFQ
jgi:hypothetical protein